MQTDWFPRACLLIAYADSGFQLEPLHVGIFELARLIESQETNAKKKLANNRARMQLAKEANEIEMRLQRTERIDANPEAREADLQAAIDALEETKPHFK